MALDIRIERVRRQDGVEGRPAPATVGPRQSQTPQSTEEARRAVEQARGRISSTLDAIEDRVEEGREELQERLDVLRPVRHRIRENGLRAIGVAFGAGMVLGLLTGGGEEREMLDEDEREELRRWRAERRGRLRQRESRARERGREVLEARSRSQRGSPQSTTRQLRHMLVSAVIAGVGDRMRHMMRERKARSRQMQRPLAQSPRAGQEPSGFQA